MTIAHEQYSKVENKQGRLWCVRVIWSQMGVEFSKDGDGVSDNGDANSESELTMEEEDCVPETEIV